MSNIVNLRTARKRAIRHLKDQHAAVNRISHGQPKAADKLHTARVQKASRDLDRHRIGTRDDR